MKKYGVLHAPLLSFFSKPLYQDVARNWQGTCLLYLLVLLAVCWIPTTVKMHTGLSRFVADEAPPVVQQIPPISIRNGIVSISEPQPYYINDPKTGRTLAIIDTTGTITSIEGTEAMVLLTRNKLIAAKSKVETRTYDLSTVQSFDLDQQKVTAWLSWANQWLVFIFYPLCLLGSYAYRILQALVYALIGLLFAGMVGTRLSYQTLMRLAIIATTPAIILNTIVSVAGVRIPWWRLICFLIAMAYLYYAVKVNREPAPEPGLVILEEPPSPQPRA